MCYLENALHLLLIKSYYCNHLQQGNAILFNPRYGLIHSEGSIYNIFWNLKGKEGYAIQFLSKDPPKLPLTNIRDVLRIIRKSDTVLNCAIIALALQAHKKAESCTTTSLLMSI